jgi:dolichyl-phosphate beta-glucosyltransferase
LSLVIVMPTHNDFGVIDKTVADLAAVKSKYDIRRVILCENGSRDETFKQCQDLAQKYGDDFVVPLTEKQGGIGHGIHAGMVWLSNHASLDYEKILITASDLPFGYTDLENAMPHYKSHDANKTYYIGSKGLKESELSNSLARQLFSLIFRVLRFIFLGITIRDTQGTFILPKAAVGTALKVKARDFFYTMELCYHLNNDGYSCVEVPIKMREAMRASTVRPLKHGMALVRQLIKLRFS